MIELCPPSPFIVLSLPRSRSAWMKHWLSYGGEQVGHDIATECESVADFKDRLARLSGTCETGAVLGWRLIREELPTARLVVVKRDPLEVWKSLSRFGIDADLDDLVRKWVLLDVVSALPGTLTLSYESLADPLVCKTLFEHCLDLPFDWGWWEQFSSTRIEVDMGLRLQRLVLNRGRMDRFKAEVAARTAKLGESHSCLN